MIIFALMMNVMPIFIEQEYLSLILDLFVDYGIQKRILMKFFIT